MNINTIRKIFPEYDFLPIWDNEKYGCYIINPKTSVVVGRVNFIKEVYYFIVDYKNVLDNTMQRMRESGLEYAVRGIY